MEVAIFLVNLTAESITVTSLADSLLYKMHIFSYGVIYNCLQTR